jgi:hypothetical protein
MNARLVAVSALTVVAVSVAVAVPQEETLPIDRWLISDAFHPDSLSTSRLDTDLLEAPGEPGVLPDRGLSAAGASWLLHRDDAVSGISLNRLISDAQPGTVVYAHAYARLPEDRTLRFSWSGDECTAGRAWLNGRRIAGNDLEARFGAGWNTILLKLEAGACAFGYQAVLSSTAADDLDQVRLQASRPPGDVRTGPEPWIISDDVARIARDLRWARDRLFAALVIDITAWGRSPVSDVEVELRGPANGKASTQWLTPGETRSLSVPIRLDRLTRIMDAGGLDARIRWKGTDVERRLLLDAERPEVSDSIALDGWVVRSVSPEAQAERIDGQLPNAAGWVLEGEWKVPESLSGRTLVLKTESSPGEYRLQGSLTEFAGDGVTLCAPCSKGTKLAVTVRTTGAWDSMPVVRANRSAVE